MTLVIRNAAQLVTPAPSGGRAVSGSSLGRIVRIAGGALVSRAGRIEWIGPTADLPPLPADADIIDATGQVVLPGFVDSHTHLIFAGSREDEFEQRLQGLTYQQIAERGGGINATVRRVRAAAKEE